MLTFDSGKLLRMFFHHVIGVLNLGSCLMDVMIKMSDEVCLSESHGDIISGCFIFVLSYIQANEKFGRKKREKYGRGVVIVQG